MDECPMMERFAKAAKERDEYIARYKELAQEAVKLREQNRRLTAQKEELINRIMRDKLCERRRSEKRVKEQADVFISCAWKREN